MSSPHSFHSYGQAVHPAQGQQQGTYGTAAPAMGPGVYGQMGQAAYAGYAASGPGAYHAMPYPGQVPAGYYPGYEGYYAQGYYQGQAQQTPFFNFGSERFLKGVLIGAAAAYLLTNESVQRTAIKSVVKVWSVLQGGVEEIKERFQDAEAEIRAAEVGHQD